MALFSGHLNTVHDFIDCFMVNPIEIKVWFVQFDQSIEGDIEGIVVSEERELDGLRTCSPWGCEN